MAYAGDAISLLSNRVSQVSVQRHLMLDENMWPPEQPKSFSPLLLIQYQHQRTPEEDTALNNWIQAGNIDAVPSVVKKHHLELKGTKCTDLKAGYHKSLQEFFNSSTVTREVATILLPFDTSDEPCFILIEGPPGIGKSLLLKEIAYRWGKKQVLKAFKLVLLVCLRYPAFQHAKSISKLLCHFCEGDSKATEISTECSDYFFKNNGKDLLFLFDGFDELPKEFQKNSLIAKILQRKVLPNCGLIVSSRPHVSAYLRDYAKYKVDILGFGKTEQRDYIKNAFTRDPKKGKELNAYLSHHATICSLCFVPYNMVVLVYLHNKGIKLPKNFVDLYNYFICLTIRHHLAKNGHPLSNTITDITNLPDPYNKIIKQLSKFSLETLNREKLIFTLNEIKIACPDILEIPGAINGFGLLQAVQSFGLTEETLNFNFVHYSVQEFLAAHYIAHLSQRDQLQALQQHDISRNSDILFLYIAIKGKIGFTCKLFLSGGNRKMALSEEFLTDQLQCLRLYHCFNEINEKEICDNIEKAAVFNLRKINLKHYTLTAYDVECIADFIMASFHQEWDKLCLDGCYIQDHGLCILQRLSNVTITMLDLDNNGLTSSSSSVISDITTNCRVEWLSIAGNSRIGEENILYSMLTSSFSVLKELYMQRINLSTDAAKYLFDALKTEKTKLQVLNVMNNDITDDACGAITDAIKRNTSLCTLKMQRNPISEKSVYNILEALLGNNTLQVLGLPGYTRKIQDEIELSKEKVNKRRKDLKYPLLREIKYS